MDSENNLIALVCIAMIACALGGYQLGLIQANNNQDKILAEKIAIVENASKSDNPVVKEVAKATQKEIIAIQQEKLKKVNQ